MPGLLGLSPVHVVNASHAWAMLLGAGWALLFAWWLTGATALAWLGSAALLGAGALHLRAWWSRR